MIDLSTDIRHALAKHTAAGAFEHLPFPRKRECLCRNEEAKRPATRNKRITGMLERLAAPGGA